MPRGVHNLLERGTLLYLGNSYRLLFVQYRERAYGTVGYAYGFSPLLDLEAPDQTDTAFA